MSLINATGSCKWSFKIVISKIISLGIKHIAIFNVRYFLYLSIKLYSFFFLLSVLYSLNCTMVIVEKNCSFGSFYELNFVSTFHCKLSLDRKDHNLALYLRPWYADQKWVLHCIFFGKYWFISILDLDDTFRDFSQNTALFRAFKFCNFQSFYLWKQKTTLLMFEASSLSTFAQEPKMDCHATWSNGQRC